MSKRKKKNAVTLISLLLTLVVLIGFYVWYSNRDKAPDTTNNASTNKTITVAKFDTAKLASLHYVNKNADMTFVLQDNIWKSKDEPDRPINQGYVTGMLDLIREVKAIKVVTDKPDNLADFGLEKPTSIIEATQMDGTTLTLKLGNEIAAGSGYYGMVNNDGKIYLLAATYGDGLNYSETDMTQVETAPAITAENIRHIDVEKKDGNNFELIFNSGNELDYSNSSMFSWVILKPYGEGYTADASKVSALLPAYTSFNFQSCVDYNSTDLSKYGLSDPQASVYVGYVEQSTQKLDKPEKDPATGKEVTEKTIDTDKEYKLLIGDKDDAGNYYVHKDGSNAVYTMDPTAVDAMLNVKPFDTLNKFVSIPSIDVINSIDIDVNGTKYTMAIKRQTEKDKDGKDVTTATYSYNGKTVDEKTFKNVYQVMIAATYDAEIKGDVNTKDVNPTLTITYHMTIKNKEVTATSSYLPYDDSFYIVDSGNNHIRFFADKRKINDIAKAIQDFKAQDTKF